MQIKKVHVFKNKKLFIYVERLNYLSKLFSMSENHVCKPDVA